jgi:anaerobic ribonucleoside-triphosphate reductase activating protein
MMEVFINRLHYPVTALGYGRRVGLWFQGCSVQCPGCISRDTWAPGLGGVPLSSLFDTLERWLPEADGLTISGGEPFDQPLALVEVIGWWRARSAGDVLVFSGHDYERLVAAHAGILGEIDVLISDPFDAAAGQSLALRGSDNQRLHLLSELAQSRYATLPPMAQLDICVDGDAVWLAGIPRPADMARLRRALAAQGFAAATSDQPFGEVRA